MANKELHDFTDKQTSTDIEDVKTFELLASKDGQSALNITLEHIKSWVLSRGVTTSADGQSIEDDVANLTGRVSSSALTLGGISLTSDSGDWKLSADAYANDNLLVETGSSPTFTDQTLTGRLITSHSRLEDDATSLKIYRGTSGGFPTLTIDSGVVASSNDLKASGSLLSKRIKPNTGTTVSVTPSGDVGTAFTASGVEPYGSQDNYSIKSEGVSRGSLISRVTGETSSDSAIVQVMQGPNNQADVGGSMSTERHTNGSVSYTSMALKGCGAVLKFFRPSSEGSSPVTPEDSTQGRVEATAKEGFVFDSSTPVTVGNDLTVSGDITYRYASNSQSGLMTSSHVSRLELVETGLSALKADVDGNTVAITNTLGFSGVSDGTNTRSASDDDKIIRFDTTDTSSDPSKGGIEVVVSSSSDTSASNGIVDVRVGVDSTVVRTNIAQTLYSKTLVNPSISGSTITGGSVTNAAITAGTGYIKASHLGDVAVSGTPSADQVLTYNGTNWVPAAIPASGDEPTFSNGSLSEPAVRFTNDTDSGMYRDTSGLATDDGIVFVRDGSRKMTIGASDVTVNNSLRVGQYLLAGVSNTGSTLPDLMLRGTTEGLRGDRKNRSVTVRASNQDVAEFRADYTKFLKGVRRKVRKVTSSQDVRVDDSVLFVEINSVLTLPRAINVSGMELIICCTGTATQVAIEGALVGSDREPIDGLKQGISIGSNETAMLICDDQKWVRVGNSAGAVSTSTPAKRTAGGTTTVAPSNMDRFMIDFTHVQDSKRHNPTLSYFDNLTFQYKNAVTSSTSGLALKNQDGSASDVTYSGWIDYTPNHYGIASPLAEAQSYQFGMWDSLALSEGSGYSFTLSGLPAGSYTMYVVGFAEGYRNNASAIVVTEEDTFTPTSGVHNLWSEGGDIANTYIGKSSTSYRKILGASTNSADAGMGGNGFSPSRGAWVEGQHYGKGTFVLGEDKSVRVWAYRPRGFSYGNIGAFYLVKNTNSSSTTN